MIELYSIKDVSKIFVVQESRLRYWMQVGFVGPTVRKSGRFYYTFADLVAVKAAKDLIAAGLSLQNVRKNLEALKKALPHTAHPTSKLRICSDGNTIVALDDDVAFEPQTGQVVMAFNLPALGGRVAEVLAMPTIAPESNAPVAIDVEETEANAASAAYRVFVEACLAEDRGDRKTAEHLYRQAIELEPSMAAAVTNLGNLLYKHGDAAGARSFYERALELEPTQSEARYNLANVLEDLGDTELAIAELRRVCAENPDFSDAHYNLGLLLARVGGVSQAKQHLERYLELDGSSEWAGRAKTFLGQLPAA